MLLLALAAGSAPGAAGIAERVFTASDGTRLHYREAGSGRTLVFVPGWSMPGEIWDPQLNYFAARGYRAVAFDPRGQGRSEIPPSGYDAGRRARDIHELIGALGDGRVALVGWSLGVLESLAYTRNHGSDRLAALVLVDNSIGEDPPPVPDPTFLKRLKSERAQTLERFVRGMFKTPQDEKYLRRLTESALRLPLEHSVALLSYSQSRTYWREAVYRTSAPLLYAVTPRFRGQAENLQRNRPDARTAVFEQSGHALFVDEAERFNRLLEDFLGAAAAGRGRP